jgi:hypothetical protein
VAGELVPLSSRRENSRRPSSRAAIDAEFADGCPLPIVVLLKNMRWWFEQAEHLAASSDPDDQMISRVCRTQAQRAAVDAAPFLHPKLQSTEITGEIEHIHAPVIPSPFGHLTDEQAQHLLAKVEAGEIND